MNTDYDFSNNFLNKYNSGGYAAGQLSYTSGSYVKTENADITIVTDDGDRVTISSGTSRESSYTSYSALLRSGASFVEAAGDEYRSQLHSNFSLSIVGDLDSEEYEDIISALESIDSFIKSASSGNIKDLLTVAEKVEGLDSLSTLNASIKIKESMSFEQVQTAVSELKNIEGRKGRGHGHLEKLDHALDRILNSGKKHGKSHGRVKHLMDNYLSKVLDSFSKKSDEGTNSRETVELIKDTIFNRLGEKSQETGDIPKNAPVEANQ